MEVTLEQNLKSALACHQKQNSRSEIISLQSVRVKILTFFPGRARRRRRCRRRAPNRRIPRAIVAMAKQSCRLLEGSAAPDTLVALFGFCRVYDSVFNLSHVGQFLEVESNVFKWRRRLKVIDCHPSSKILCEIFIR
jgi:hypothetical protein